MQSTEVQSFNNENSYKNALTKKKKKHTLNVVQKTKGLRRCYVVLT